MAERTFRVVSATINIEFFCAECGVENEQTINYVPSADELGGVEEDLECGHCHCSSYYVGVGL